MAPSRQEVVIVGRRGPGSRIRGQPSAGATRDRQPRTHPHLRLVANAGGSGKREHQWHQAAGRLRRVEDNQVGYSLRARVTPGQRVPLPSVSALVPLWPGVLFNKPFVTVAMELKEKEIPSVIRAQIHHFFPHPSPYPLSFLRLIKACLLSRILAANIYVLCVLHFIVPFF